MPAFLLMQYRARQNRRMGPVEVIVIDDGSTDDTEQVVKLFRTVRYVKQGNSGVTAARNTGLRLSSGSYVVFLDADDRLLSEAVEGCGTSEQIPTVR
jgi:glycosyltransferase involved in cell wall biosynthesis